MSINEYVTGVYRHLLWRNSSPLKLYKNLKHGDLFHQVGDSRLIMKLIIPGILEHIKTYYFKQTRTQFELEKILLDKTGKNYSPPDNITFGIYYGIPGWLNDVQLKDLEERLNYREVEIALLREVNFVNKIRYPFRA